MEFRFSVIIQMLIFCFFTFCSNKSRTGQIFPVAIEPDAQKPGIVMISVYDNYQVNPELETGWGFACVIETPSEKILFDTGGDAEILLSNMQKMHIDPASIDKVIISHIHADHTGGLEGFLNRNHNVTVYIPSSFTDTFKNMIIAQGANYIEISAGRKISDFIYSICELNGFFLEEQALIIDSKKGLIVLTGCAHPGIVKIVERAEKLMNKNSIYLVIGGFHQPPVTVVKTFRKLEVIKVAPSHCTGDRIREAFAKEYKEDFIAFGVGKRIAIQ